MKIRMLKFVDKSLGSLLGRLLPRPVPRPFLSPKRILVIRPGGIGDAVHLIPAIRSLRMAYPESVIDLFAENRNGAVFSLSQEISNVFLYDSLRGLLAVYRNSYDLVIDTEQWHRLSAIVARLTRAPMLVGFATNERSRLFTHTVTYSHDDYEVDSFRNLLAPLSISGNRDVPLRFLSVPVQAVAGSIELLKDLAKTRFVVIFPGASIPERRWGAEKFAQVARQLSNTGIQVVVVGGKGETTDGEQIVAGGNGLNLAGRTSLAETAAVIDKCAALVSGDSGILHIAAGLDRPTVSLFGPGIAAKWAPRGDRHIVINKCLPCSPCTRFGYTPTCPRGIKCMTDITADYVVEAVKLLIRRT